MKKLFTSIFTLLLASGGMVSAQHTYDFTNWSETTVANLKADAANDALTGWSDIEKVADAENNANAVDGKCFWMAGENTSVGNNGNLYAKDELIPELEGLDFSSLTSGKRSLAIAIDYPSTSLGTYEGPSYLWLGSKELNYFIIHNVKSGATITMGVESHKPAEARGVKLFVGDNELKDPDGNAVAVPTTYQEQTWQVPEGDDPVDITVYNTNGCHVYFIDINDGSSAISGIEDPQDVAPVYYNLNGVRVDNPANGIYVRVRGDKVDKVIVR
ncbi:MAG: hypothetical protein J1F38_06345 [Muribaculaceae bacterium]|nr:hypothetical protein [Muribaculaceae bacterium]